MAGNDRRPTFTVSITDTLDPTFHLQPKHLNQPVIEIRDKKDNIIYEGLKITSYGTYYTCVNWNFRQVKVFCISFQIFINRTNRNISVAEKKICNTYERLSLKFNVFPNSFTEFADKNTGWVRLIRNL